MTSDGATITLSLEQSGTGDLTLNFSSGQSTFDCTPAATIALTAGSQSSPQDNFVYILESTLALTVSTTQWPTAEHAKVAFTQVQTAALVNTDGALINQNWNDHYFNGNLMGHLLHVTERIRREGALWKSGVAPSIAITSNGGSPDNVNIAITSGVVYQLHSHATHAVDTAAGGVVIVVNDNAGAFSRTTDLNTLLTDSAGGSMSNKFFNLTFWGVANKVGAFHPLMCNLPAGSYNTLASAEADVSGYDNLTIPDDFLRESSTGFMVVRYTFRHLSAASGTWTLESTLDLRGITALSAASGTSGNPLQEFSDNAFKVFNVADSTKEFIFDNQNITTATTRTVTLADRDLDLANPVFDSATIEQSDAAGAIPVLTLDQVDISEEMISFKGVIGTGNPIEAAAAKTLTTTHFLKVTLTGGLTRYIPVGTIG